MRMLMLLLGTLVLAQEAWPPPGMNCPQRTLVIFEQGPSASRGGELRKEHLGYLLQLMKTGKVVSAGPMQDGRSAAILFATASWDEVEQILKDEPYTREGVLKVSQHSVWVACEVAK